MTIVRWKQHLLSVLIITTLIGGFLLTGCGGGLKQGIVASRQSAVNAGVFLPSSTPFGKTYGEWGDEWWKWALSIPPGDNPLLDETGEK